MTGVTTMDTPSLVQALLHQALQVQEVDQALPALLQVQADHLAALLQAQEDHLLALLAQALQEVVQVLADHGNVGVTVMVEEETLAQEIGRAHV